MDGVRKKQMMNFLNDAQPLPCVLSLFIHVYICLAQKILHSFIYQTADYVWMFKFNQ